MAFLITTVWTTLLWLASATGTDSPTSSSVPKTINLIQALGTYNTTWQGVTLTEGPPPQLRPALLLQGDFRDLKLPPLKFQEAADLLRSNPDFTISARVKQEPGNSGTIVSFAHGMNRFLELQSSGRKNEVRLHYTSRTDFKVYVETFRYRLADNNWHQVAVTVSGSQVELLVDCESLFKRLLKPGVLDRNFSQPVQLWIGQRYTHYLFKGAMQDVKLIQGPHGYLSSCPHLDSTCPTCGQFVLLQSIMSEMKKNIAQLTKRLEEAESRISKVEECDCKKSCQFNGTVHEDGTSWLSGCQNFTCMHGEVQCSPVQCNKTTCKHPVYNKTGDCCKICLRNCMLEGNFYDHGEIVTQHKCVECYCDDGTMKCDRINPETFCPKLTCPKEQQFSVPDQCCKFCPDIDECQQEGGLEGHHCHLNTRCVNTLGSYICECLPGYRRIDKFNCAEMDECSSGEHNCDVNAECINTQGSYHCVCKEGYTGDGYSCQPVCIQKCLNGGVCRSPGKCACPNGFIGASCEKDLDECATNSHRCTNVSECVNMMGWYYCKCKVGYDNPYVDNNNLGTRCLDINECNTDLHTCHPSAQCINTPGGFECNCPSSQPNCKLSCMFEGEEIPDGGRPKSPKKDLCESCICVKGVMKCEKPRCDCNSTGSDTNHCCPQCNSKHACRHQELTEVLLTHGEQWLYQCQMCECKYGEVDCWDMMCPPLLCDNPVRNSEDCCPHCDDPCSLGNVSALGQPCTFAGRMYQSGSQIIDPSDPCTACNCKDGVLCCSYNYDCGNDSRSVGFDGVVASTTSAAGGHFSGASDSAEETYYNNKQYNIALGRASNSAGLIYVSDSDRGNKTEKSPAGGPPGG